MTIKVLLIEDNPDHLEITKRILRTTGEGYQVDSAIDSLTGLKKIFAGSYDVILCDYRLPDSTALDVLKEMNKNNNVTPFIVMTAFGNEKLAVDVMKGGAYDYIVKDLMYQNTLDIVIKKAIDRWKVKNEKDKLEREIHALFDQTFQFIGLMTPEGILTEVNKSALEFSGVPAASVLNKPFWETVWWMHSPELQEKLRQSVQKVALGEFIRFEATHLSRDKKLHYIDFSLKPVKDEKGKVIFMIPEGRDITERKESEEELRNLYTELKETQVQLIQAEKLYAIGQLASGVAHEVRNPLGIIMQGINYLENRLTGERGGISETLVMLKASIKRADKIIESLFDFSRASTLELEPQDINSILEVSLGLLRTKFKFDAIEIVMETEKGLPLVMADRNKLEQVLINLLLNAMQAMPKGGKIFVRTYEKKLLEAKNGVGKRDGDYFRNGEVAVIVEIEDTGIGIPEKNMKKIFDPFFTTKGPRDGAGLGLSVTKNIIAMHKGLIEVSSKEGQGTRVLVTLKIKGGVSNG